MKRAVGALVLGIVVSANAEKIPLRAGSIEFDSVMQGDGPVHLEGRNFTFDGWAQLARLEAVDCVFGCDAGETMSLGMFVSGNNLPGIATFHGVEYSDVGSLIGPNQMQVNITGQTTLPRFGNKTEKTKTVKVKMGGLFSHAAVPFPYVTETLVGAGVATVILEKMVDPTGEDAWIVTHLSYDITKE